MYSQTYYDQVEKKKQRLEKVNTVVDEVEIESPLPSRMELHHSKKNNKKKKKKSGSIFPKVLLTFFILLPISTIVAYTYFSKHQPFHLTSEPAGGEEILYETNKSDSSQNNEPEENTSSISHSSSLADSSDSRPKTNESIEIKTEEKNNANSSVEGNKQQSNDSSNIQIVNHIVQPNETLFSIAMKYYNSQDGIEKIIQQNQIINNEIQAGQTLQIPLPK